MVIYSKYTCITGLFLLLQINITARSQFLPSVYAHMLKVVQAKGQCIK